ncbi:hypothetical protein [Burkholderia vietnamiensis]|uniref:hypothetical protein n=1 Tax=Burkholderia vietnamiensis TaxID=60552 RepID=UPI001D15A294|nr:hypothetical protein [Burkholderia vietnamiensis]UEC01961.1 hypothetical protein LK462_08035 [Burkholderia vietnamiensis]
MTKRKAKSTLDTAIEGYDEESALAEHQWRMNQQVQAFFTVINQRVELLKVLPKCLAALFAARRRWEGDRTELPVTPGKRARWFESYPHGCRDSSTMLVEADRYAVMFEGVDGLHVDDLVVLLLCVAVRRKEGRSDGFYFKLMMEKCHEWIGPVSGWLNDDIIHQTLFRLDTSKVTIELDGLADRLTLAHCDRLSEYSDDPSARLGFLLDTASENLLVDDLARVDLVRLVNLRSDLAKWLHVYLVCRRGKAENDMPLEELRQLSGYGDLPADVFRRDLDVAITELQTERAIERDGQTIVTIPPQFPKGMAVANDVLHLELELMAQDARPRHVFVVTTFAAVSDGFIDFHKCLAKYGNAIDGVVRMKPAKRDRDNTRHLAEAIETLTDTYDLGPNDIVAIVRGGGPEEQFTMFQSTASIAAVMGLRQQGVHVVSGVGHTKDQWAIDKHVDYAAEVPFAAGQYVNALLDKAKNRPVIAPKRRVFPVRGAPNRAPASPIGVAL